jgi:hypothetical protein
MIETMMAALVVGFSSRGENIIIYLKVSETGPCICMSLEDFMESNTSYQIFPAKFKINLTEAEIAAMVSETESSPPVYRPPASLQYLPDRDDVFIRWHVNSFRVLAPLNTVFSVRPAAPQRSLAYAITPELASTFFTERGAFLVGVLHRSRDEDVGRQVRIMMTGLVVGRGSHAILGTHVRVLLRLDGTTMITVCTRSFSDYEYTLYRLSALPQLTDAQIADFVRTARPDEVSERFRRSVDVLSFPFSSLSRGIGVDRGGGGGGGDGGDGGAGGGGDGGAGGAGRGRRRPPGGSERAGGAAGGRPPAGRGEGGYFSAVYAWFNPPQPGRTPRETRRVTYVFPTRDTRSVTYVFSTFRRHQFPTSVMEYYDNGMPIREYLRILAQTIEFFDGDEEIVVQLLDLIRRLP